MRGPLWRAAPLLAFAAVAAGAARIVRARRAIDFRGKTVLVSGGSRGLGLELARRFAKEGADLILLARDSAALERAAAALRGYGPRVMIFPCDVTDAQAIRHVLAQLDERGASVDVLVNNAGTIQVGPVEHMRDIDYQSALAVHFWAPLHLIQEMVPRMRERGGGRIVNIASIGGKVGVPHLTPYSASKFALVGLSECLRAELLKDGIYVTTVCPGLMRTGSHLNARFKGQHEKEYALFSIANASPLFSTSAETAARRIVEACRHGSAEITITPQANALRVLNGVFPAALAEIFALIHQVLPKKSGPDGDRAQTGAESRSPISASIFTAPADRAAIRNNEMPRTDPAEKSKAGDSSRENNRIKAGDDECRCAHPTHFTGRCGARVTSPSQLCSECMENHFQPVDDPAI